MELTVGITGASGVLYAQRTLIHLAASGVVERINLIMSEAAVTVAQVELGVSLRGEARTINELVDHLVFRILDQFGIPHTRATQWRGAAPVTEPATVEGD